MIKSLGLWKTHPKWWISLDGNRSPLYARSFSSRLFFFFSRFCFSIPNTSGDPSSGSLHLSLSLFRLAFYQTHPITSVCAALLSSSSTLSRSLFPPVRLETNPVWRLKRRKTKRERLRQKRLWNNIWFICLYRYTKPISGIGIGAQKYNAEVRVSRSDVDSHLVQLSDRLRHVRQVNIIRQDGTLVFFFFIFCPVPSCVVYVVRDEICTVPCCLAQREPSSFVKNTRTHDALVSAGAIPSRRERMITNDG